MISKIRKIYLTVVAGEIGTNGGKPWAWFSNKYIAITLKDRQQQLLLVLKKMLSPIFHAVL